MTDLKIAISTAKSRTSTAWRQTDTTWGKLVRRCSAPTVTPETPDQWAAMTRDERGRVKDCGGFVGGRLRDGIRKRGHCISRSLLTLDIDHTDNTPEGIWGWLETLMPDTAALMYSTHSHTRESPRLRLVIPLDRELPRDLYEPLARKVAAELDIEMFDVTTFDPERLFYWPSHGTGAEFVRMTREGKPLDTEKWLSFYDDPSDPREWPRAGTEPEEVTRQASAAGKAENPAEKRGAVGAFCRAYPVHLAIDTFLPHLYAPTDSKNRYTYRYGTSTGGLVIYDNLWAYSFHETDPAQGRLLNAFDLVRVHLYGNLDRGKSADDPTALPSYAAMCGMCADRREVTRELAAADLGQIDVTEGEAAAGETSVTERTPATGENPEAAVWTELLDYTKKGDLCQTVKNAITILENDPRLCGRIYHNQLTGRTETTGGLPWKREGAQWRDEDDANLRVWMETHWGLTGRERLFDAVTAVSTAHPRHPVREYLNALKWDGVPRVERLLIDRLGADDTPATREMTRNHLAAAVMRVYEPGSKYDHMIVLAGKEGIGKSALIRTLGGEWYTDSVTTAEGKESMDQLQGVWIVEHSELTSTKRADVETFKAYITRQNDRYRPAYGRRVTDHPRQCVFFGTTNESNFLKGDTGNRRIWVVPCAGVEDTSWMTATGNDRDQIWAEAKALYDNGLRGAALELSRESETEAWKRQNEYNDMSDDPLWGQIDDFLDMLLPDRWPLLNEQRRYVYVHDPGERGDIDTYGRMGEKRNIVCAMEVMHEVMGLRQSDPYIARKINNYIEAKPDWERGNPQSFHAAKLYGKQRAFVRRGSLEAGEKGNKTTILKYNEDEEL